MDYSRANLWHLALKLLILKLQVQQRGVWMGILCQKNMENSSVKLFKHDIILWNSTFPVTALAYYSCQNGETMHLFSVFLHEILQFSFSSFYLSEMYPNFFSFSLIVFLCWNELMCKERRMGFHCAQGCWDTQSGSIPIYSKIKTLKITERLLRKNRSN